MIRLTGVLLASLAWGATAVAGGDCVAARTLKDVPVYEPGEEIAFELSVRGFEGRDRAGWCFSWQRTGDDGKREEGKAPADKPFVYRTSLDRPGFVRLHGTLVAADGKPVRRIVREKSVPTIFDLGAGVAIGKIAPAAAEPADFDALWARHRANLAGVAWKDAVQLKAIPSPVAGMRLYEFSLPCYGGHPATGHLAVPEKAGTYPAWAKFFGYNESWTYRRAIAPPRTFAANRLSIWVSAHGFEMGHEESYYKGERQRRTSNGYGHAFDPAQNADPETAYFAGMTYRIMRALEFLKSRPEWDGKNLTVTGGSQGGLQSIWAAALVPGVSECAISIPWCCDMAGSANGRNHGTWYVKWAPGLGYYDPVNMAPRIPATCRVTVAMAGLGDYVCPPTGVMAFYNRIAKAPKSILFVQNAQHGNHLQSKPEQSFSIEGEWRKQ